MKKYKMLSLLVVPFLFMTSVKALSEEEYNRLRLVYSDERISTMSEEKIKQALSYDLENAKITDTYYKGVAKNNDSYTWTEISESEYENTPDVMPSSVTYETTYKKISLAVIPIGNYYDFDFSATWKYLPTVRSYDVMAMRFNNVALDYDVVTGDQTFKIKGDSTLSHVNYSPNGTNIKKFNNGFGISMNLVNNDITYLELSIEAQGKVSGTNPQVWASYQHAVDDVTLAISQDYTLSSAGYGNVINFNYEIEDHYDEMRGVTYKIS